MEATRRPAIADAAIACALACTLAAIGAWRHWSDLSVLNLPDADDMMRLQQIRDWLGGQSFADLKQYRLGPHGVPMHWSRLNDLMPAALIWTLEPFVGRHGAELAAVIAWPTMLLAAAIALIGRIARVLGGEESARPAMILCAIAYPASTLFVPGRIDHHALQVVLLLITVLTLVATPRRSSGMIAGVAIGLSLVVGMEMAPLLGVAAGFAIVSWALWGAPQRDRLLGLGIGLAGTTLAAMILFHTWAWDYPACDGFTAISARAAVLSATVPLGLALPRGGTTLKSRALLVSISAVLWAAAVAFSTPQCLSPFGQLDPTLRQFWLTRVGEFQALDQAPAAVALGYAGLPVAGLAVTAWWACSTRARGWVLLLALQLTAAALMIGQLRGAYAGAILATPALGAMIAASRGSGALPLAGAWVVSAGMLYPMAAQALTVRGSGAPLSSCTAPDLIATLGRLPSGSVMAPIDTAAPAIAGTRHRLIAGPYHRNGEGDLAMYSFYRATPNVARDIARRLNIRWVIACDGFGGVSAPFDEQLQHGKTPDWLREVQHVPSGARIFATSISPPLRRVQVNNL